MRLATWNVNSIRARIDRVVAWLERSDIDVAALQETKCRDDQFPYDAFKAAGYEVTHWGGSQWNGVAVASRVGLTEVQHGFPGMPAWGDPPVAEARALGATCGGVRVWSLYVPNGRSLADPHLQYKLQWLDALRVAGTGWLATDPEAQVALVGDWNIAPRTRTSGTWRCSPPAPTCRRPSAPPSRPSSRPGTPTWCVRTRRGSSRTGTTPSCASPP